MSSLIPLLAIPMAALIHSTDAYTVTAYSEANCQGTAQQSMSTDGYGSFCYEFNNGAASVGVSGVQESSSDPTQFIFCDGYPCSTSTQTGSFLGNGCITAGQYQLKAWTNVIPEGSAKIRKRDVGTVTTWTNSDCSGDSTNEEVFETENVSLYLNNVVSIMVQGVPSDDLAYACSDQECHVADQVAQLNNNQCVDVSGKNVQSAMVIGVPTPARRDMPTRQRRAASGSGNGIECATSNLADYEDALMVGDDFEGEGSQGESCCCTYYTTQNYCKTDGTAEGCVSDSFRCPVDANGGVPPVGSCPITCNEVRGYIYGIATQCKNSNGQTGGTVTLPGGTITVSSS